MRFKATFSEVGVGWLEKRFLPCFEKLAPVVQLTVLLLPQSAHLIYDAKATGGPEVHVDFVVAELFSEYRLQSAYGNKVAFRLEAGLLRRVLAGLAVSDTARVEVRLTKTPAAGAGAGAGGAAAAAAPPPPSSAPFLEVTALGADVHVRHGVPLLGPPLRRSEVDAAEAVARGGAVAVPYWLALAPPLAARLCDEVRSLRAASPTLELATTPAGALYLRCLGPSLDLGAEHSRLPVAWSPGADGGARGAAAAAAAAATPAAAGAGGAPTTPAGRLASARAAGGAAEAAVLARDLLFALSFAATRCDALLLGVAAHGGFVELGARYDRDGGAAPDAVALGLRLPTRDAGGGGGGDGDGGGDGGAGG